MAQFTIYRWQSLLEFCLLTSVCEAYVADGNEVECRIYGRVSENDGPILSCLWTKVHES